MSAATVLGPGHPDQACDLVVASVVEEYLRRDPESRLNIRACGGKGALFLAGEVCSKADFDVSATVQQTLAACGVLGVTEPFITFEPMHASWASTHGSHEPVTVQGYATNETAELVPKANVLARSLACLLEQKRTQDPDWFWLGGDYEVTVYAQGDVRPIVFLRAEHADTCSLVQVRARIQALCATCLPDADIRINPAGEETHAGLAHRIGSSGRINTEIYTRASLVSSGIGWSPTHPRNAGTIACRLIARQLVQSGKGKAVAVRATWFPLEARAALLRAWNQDGEDLSDDVQARLLDLSELPPVWRAPPWITASVKYGTDATIVLPWEV